MADIAGVGVPLGIWRQWMAGERGLLAARVTSLGTLSSWWAREDPLVSNGLMSAGVAGSCLVGSWLTGNCSQVDKAWNLVPFCYVWNYLLRHHAETGKVDARLAIMAGLSTCWGLRLAYQFARKGGFSGEEDYRWPELRRIIGHPALFQLFNVGFVACYQNLLVLLMVTPADAAYRAAAKGGVPLSLTDCAATALYASLFVMEAVADQQQWDYQTAKKEALAKGGAAVTPAFRRGFVTSGLFRYSRHPNFFAEQGMWVSFYLFSLAAGGALLNWTLIGPVLLLGLFQGSTPFTESISARRHPEYKEYQKTTSRLVPWFPGAVTWST